MNETTFRRLLLPLAAASVVLASWPESRAFDGPAVTGERLAAMFEKAPDSLVLVLASHFSDNDFGYEVRSGEIPRGDFLWPIHRINDEAAARLVRALGDGDFAKNAEESERDARFRPGKPGGEGRVFGITLRLGDRAFFEEVARGEAIRARAATIHKALGAESDAGRAFERGFLTKLGE